MLKRYPLDPSASSPLNLVAGEVHTLDAEGHRLLFTLNGAYYHQGLVVKQSGRLLTPDKDYSPRFFWQYATEKLGHPVFLAIEITNPNLLGEIEISYQVVGGLYQDRFEGLDQLLKTLPRDTRGVYWDEILEKPLSYFPERHLHHVDDVFGLTPLVKAIDVLRQQLENVTTLKLKSVYDRFLKHRQYVENLVHDLDESLHKVNTIVTSIDTRVNNLGSSEEINNELARLTAAVENNLRGEMGGMVSDVTSKVEGLTSELATLTQSTQSNQTIVTQKLLQFSENFETAQQQFTDAISAVTKGLNDYKVEVDRRLDTLEESMTSDKRANETRLDAIENSIEEKETNFNRRIEETETKIDDAKESVLTTLGEKENALTVRITQAAETAQNALTEKVSELTELIDGKIETTEGKITQLRQDVEEKEQGIDQRISTMRQSLEEKDADLENKYETLKEDHEDTKSSHQTRLTNVESQLTTKIAEVNQSIEDAKEAAKSANDATNESINELSLKIDNHERKIDAKADEVKEEINATINEKESALKEADAGLSQRLNSLESRITLNDQASTETVGGLSVAFNTFKQQAEQTLQSNSAQIASIKEKDTEQDSRLDDLEQSINEKNTNTNQRIDTLTNNLASDKESLEGSISALRTELTDSISQKVESLTEKDTQLSNKINEVESSLTEKESTLNGKISTVSDALDAYKTEVSLKHNSLDGEISDLKDTDTQLGTKIQKVEEALDEYKSSNDTALGETNKSVNELKTEVSETKELIDTKTNEVKQSLETNRSGLQSQIDTLREKDTRHESRLTTLGEQVQENNGDITNITSRLEQYKEELEEKITTDTETMRDSVKSEILETVNANHSAALAEVGKVNTKVTQLNQAVETLTEKSQEIEPLKTKVTENYKALDARILTITGNVIPYKVKELNAAITQVSEALNVEKGRIEALETAKASHSQQLSGLTGKVSAVETFKQTAESEISTLKNKVQALEERPVGNDNAVDGEAVRTIARGLINDVIAEARQNANAEDAIRPEDFIIHPDSEGSVNFGEDGSITISGIVYMKERHFAGMSENLNADLERHHVFTPATIHEFDTSTTWVVPDSYDGLLAEIYVTTGIRPAPEQTGGTTAFFTPSTKKMYVVLKGGESVPITIGTISSFGKYVTNDGVNMQGLIHPSFPIVTNLYGANATTDIRTMYGKGGRVVVMV